MRASRYILSLMTAFLMLTPFAAQAQSNSGVDTPPGVHSLPLSVEGDTVMTVSDQPSNDVIVNGAVGIGTAAPQAMLDVNGSVRAGPVTTGSVCSPEGSFGYDFTKHTPMYCDKMLVWASISAASGPGTAVYNANASNNEVITTPVAYNYCALTASGNSGGCGRCIISGNANGTWTLNQASCTGSDYMWCTMTCW